MSCQRCGTDRVLKVRAKCGDQVTLEMTHWNGLTPEGKDTRDGMPDDLEAIGYGDYINIRVCLECGQVQGEFPLPETALEEVEEED